LFASALRKIGPYGIDVVAFGVITVSHCLSPRLYSHVAAVESKMPDTPGSEREAQACAMERLAAVELEAQALQQRNSDLEAQLQADSQRRWPLSLPDDDEAASAVKLQSRLERWVSITWP
jgi:hypothetical protein